VTVSSEHEIWATSAAAARRYCRQGGCAVPRCALRLALANASHIRSSLALILRPTDVSRSSSYERVPS
jgi:hypothetical protein